MAGDFIEYCKQVEAFFSACGELGITDIEYTFSDYKPAKGQQNTYLRHLKKIGVVTEAKKIEEQVHDIVTRLTLADKIYHQGYHLTVDQAKVLTYFSKNGLLEKEKVAISITKDGYISQSSYGEVGEPIYQPESGQLPAAILSVLVSEGGENKLSAKNIADRINRGEYLSKTVTTGPDVTTSIGKINSVIEKRLYTRLIFNEKGYRFNDESFDITLK